MRVFRGCCMGVGSSPRMEGYAPRQAHNHRRVAEPTDGYLVSLPAAVPMLPPGSARKRLAGNSPSNPANRWGPRLRGCTGGVCMYYVPLFREVLYIRYGTPLPLRESASTTIRGYRFPAEHRNSRTRTLSERAAEPRERPGRRQRAAPPSPPLAAEQTNTNATDKRPLHIQQAHHRRALTNDAG